METPLFSVFNARRIARKVLPVSLCKASPPVAPDELKAHKVKQRPRNLTQQRLLALFILMKNRQSGLFASEIALNSNGRIGRNNIYTLLSHLESDGLVLSSFSGDTESLAIGRTRYFISEDGLVALRLHQSELEFEWSPGNLNPQIA